jgi:hypothetical protein
MWICVLYIYIYLCWLVKDMEREEEGMKDNIYKEQVALKYNYIFA